MALNAISNYAANVAHRNLQTSDTAATSSLAKLSSGTRVVSARDDAASLAIGSRLNAEVAALRQASVNAGQAVSMLQIADGAMAKVQDIQQRVRDLQKMEKALKRLMAACSGRGPLTECPILEALEDRP
jgi:flagellin